MNSKERKRRARSQQSHLQLQFLGANKTVTGSLHFLEFTNEEGKTIRFFVDMGLNQENEGMNFQNRLPAGLKASDVAFGIFTHAHIDHVGYFPKLVKDGFSGPVYATPPTADLLGILLPDSGHIQEEDAGRKQARAQRRDADAKKTAKQNPKPQRGGKKPVEKPEVKSIVPLYTEQDARASLRLVQAIEFGKPFSPAEGITFRFLRASHLLGAAIVLLEIGKGSKKRRVCFSGDIGRPGMPIIKDVERVKQADYVVCEGTYGARLHEKRDRLKSLEQIINAAYERALKGKGKEGAGVILMPAFAVGRVQSVLIDLQQLMKKKRIPAIPVMIDSPMANLATEIHRKHSSEFNKATLEIAAEGDPFRTPEFAELMSMEQSLKLDLPASRPIIILSSSGMATGGRIMRHLQKRLPGQHNTIVFVGFQAEGTLGRQLLGPEKTARIAGVEVAVRASVEYLQDYSGHGDYNDIINWLRGFDPKPRKLFLVHGDSESLESLKEKAEALGFHVEIPGYRDTVDLD
ncbi:MAG: MBL fold metallo-hydrolase [Candidatus Obscuribacterales bacterium]|nr:MBL fold metallo-hydrolase [Candidatus Obscuribacterales bacterium]